MPLPSRALALATLLLAAQALPALAQFPNRAVTLVVPFPPGGGTDTGARVIAQKLSERWGQPVIIENKPGAAGIVGTDLVAKARPDGYTILMGNVGTQSINPALYAKLPFDAATAFEPISLVAELPLVLVVTPGLAAHSVAELIALAKARPGDLTYGTSGNGTAMHLAAALFEHGAGLQFLHVPYKGGGPAIQDVIAGHIKFAFATILETSGQIKGAKLRPLAVTSDNRSPTLPDVPTVAESGLPGFNSISWIGLLAPAATPADIVARISADVQAVLSIPEVRDRLAALGATPAGTTPAAFKQLIDTDRARYARIVADKGIKAD